jgi:hypothetical protein
LNRDRHQQGLDRRPGFERERGSQRRRQALGHIDELMPPRDAGILVPIEVIGERIALAPYDPGVRHGPVGARHGRVDGC